jgi:hypothetical protein
MATDENCREFIADVPNGKHHVWIVFDDCGYWGGEAATHNRRSITAEGKEAWIDDRGDAGPNDYLYRFENIDPKPGDDLWDLYLRDLFKPARFCVDITDGQLNLQFASDAPWSCKVAAMIIYPDANKAEAEKWVANVEERNKQEFRGRAVYMGTQPNALNIPADAVKVGYWMGIPTLDETITFNDAPGKPLAVASELFNRQAVAGQKVSFSAAIRPLKDFGDAKLVASDLKGPVGTILAANVDLRYVHHSTSRDFNDIAYTIMPATLRKLEGRTLKLSKDLTRQFWITVNVPKDAQPGAYTGDVKIAFDGNNIPVPISVEVLDFALNEPDYSFGFLGTAVPNTLKGEKKSAAMRELLLLLKENGMNSLAGGPSVPFKGLKADGTPDLDFAATDEYFKLLRECGFTKEIYNYGGPGVTGLHDGYVIGSTGKAWEEKTGKSFKELLKIVWSAVKEHGERNNWLPVVHVFTDEPRTVESARAQVELMKAYREAVPFVKIGGLYSVHWGDREIDLAIQDIFKTLAWSGLNKHVQTDLDKAKEFGREIYIYNQANSRYGFGAYQWAEMSKGVKGRIQWALLALHGYQYFSLDGREPDTAMINWGRNEIYPTIYLQRCREGADDFRFAVTLANLAEQKKGILESMAAKEFLESVSKKIGVGQTYRPEGFMNDDTFRRNCIEHIKNLRSAK